MSFVDSKSSTTGKYPICKINGTKSIYVDLDYDLDIDDAKTEITAKSIEFMPYIPNDDQRFGLFLAGPGGVGKSYATADIVRKLKKMKKYKDNIVILFTTLESPDKAYDKIDYHKINIYDEDLYTKGINYFKDSICIFDDYISDLQPDTTKLLRGLVRFLLENGRKNNIALVASTHVILDNLNTKYLLGECAFNCFYPRGDLKGIMNFARSYLGITRKKDMDEFEALIKNSRIIYIHRNYPRYVITRNKIKML